nr:MjaI family restriction endonuclease [uncultured Flavobacterium sp.]
MGAEKFGDKEQVLNLTAQRFQLTRPGSVGPTMELINECDPQSLSEWKTFYFEKAYTRKKDKKKITDDLLHELGQKLYNKIHDTIIPIWTKSFNEITVEDCIDYIYDVTLERSYDGFHRENAVYRELGVAFDGVITFEKTDSVTDSAWSIDYIGHIRNSTIKIGIQVKPMTAKSNSSGYSIANRNLANYQKFKDQFGGEVFEVYSKKMGKKNVIVNKDVIEKISSYLQGL